MRLVIKGADYSQVSIGKVEKDMSFEINADNFDKKFLNPPSSLPGYAGAGDNAGTTIYLASNGDANYIIEDDNANRFVSDFIEVEEGMVISGIGCTNTSTTPSVICFNSSKETVTPVNTTTAAWSDQDDEFTFVVPSGVKYVKIQASALMGIIDVVGTTS